MYVIFSGWRVLTLFFASFEVDIIKTQKRLRVCGALRRSAGVPLDFPRVFPLEVQQRYFSHRAILVAIVSQNVRGLFSWEGGGLHNYRAICCKKGYRTDVQA